MPTRPSSLTSPTTPPSESSTSLSSSARNSALAFAGTPSSRRLGTRRGCLSLEPPLRTGAPCSTCVFIISRFQSREPPLTRSRVATQTTQLPEWALPMSAYSILATRKFYSENLNLLAATNSNSSRSRSSTAAIAFPSGGIASTETSSSSESTATAESVNSGADQASAASASMVFSSAFAMVVAVAASYLVLA
jgi:hypothetical protein